MPNPDHPTATREAWLAARDELLVREKEHTRRGDELAQARRALPWVRIDTPYRFDTEDGPKTLRELFGDRSQLLVYTFMFGTDYEAGCPICSSIADTINATLPHLSARDATTVFISRAPQSKLQPFRARMGWDVPWASTVDDSFTRDFAAGAEVEETRARIAPMLDANGELGVASDFARATGTDVATYISERPNFLTFVREGDTVYLTYSTTARGLEFIMGYYQILDRTPFGRGEEVTAQRWVRRHDEYAHAGV